MSSPRPDPFTAQRIEADQRYRRGEARVYAAVKTAVTLWLDAARALVLGQPFSDATDTSEIHSGEPGAAAFTTPMTAAAEEPAPDLENVSASFRVWDRALREHVEPALSEAFGEAFLARSRAAQISPHAFQLEYLEQVHDRLVIWPQGAFEELRPELLEALDNAETIDQVQDRIGRILGIDAPARRIRADINDIDRCIADPETPPGELPALRGQRRALWQQHDERNLEWQWLARRIARTEIHGAIEGGTLAGALATEDAGGTGHHKRWLATTDDRVRHSHTVADGQVCKLREQFTVGRAQLQHPGAAGGPGHEVINCRCSMMILTDDELRDALDSEWGGLGVRPGSIRVGPDNPDDVQAAIDRVKAEQRGEVVEWPDAPDPARVDPAPDPEPEPSLLSRATRNLIDEVRETLPEGADGWAELTRGAQVRPAETEGERRLWNAAQQFALAQQRLDDLETDPRIAGSLAATTEELRSEVVRRARAVESFERKVKRATGTDELIDAGAALLEARAQHDTLSNYLAARQSIDTARRDLDYAERMVFELDDIVPPQYASGYPTDAQGNLLPPPELLDHLDRVLDVGHAALADIAAAMHADSEVRAARAEVDRTDTSGTQFQADQAAVARAEQRVILTAIAEARDLGGHEQRIIPSRPVADGLRAGTARTVADLRVAEQVFPTAWLQAADGRGGLVVNEARRAYFQAAGGGGGRDLIAAHARRPHEHYLGAFENIAQEIAMHELGHRMERAIAGLTYLEFALVRRRATDEHGQLERLVEILRGEYVLRDRWLRDYAGKIYGHGSTDPATVAHEVFQVGLQDVFGREPNLEYGGDELHAFVLGVILLL